MTASGQGPDTTLLVIAKQPTPGRVKTRLVPPFTHEHAAAPAEAVLRDVDTAADAMTVAAQAPGSRFAARAREFAAVPPPPCAGTRAGTLGERA